MVHAKVGPRHGARCPGALDQSVLFQGEAGRHRPGPGDSPQLPDWVQVCQCVICRSLSSYFHVFPSIAGDTRVPGPGDWT